MASNTMILMIPVMIIDVSVISITVWCVWVV